MLRNQNILVGVAGSIAAYKACDLVQRLKEKGAAVRVAMTHSAIRLVHPNTFAALTGSPVADDAWTEVADGAMRHIELARWANAFVIAPCTAHTLAELSMGTTGSVVSMTALAYTGPLIVAPAMNTVMLESAPVREHLRRLTGRGVHVLPTLSGDLACGEIGDGKLITPEEIAAYVDLILSFQGDVPDLKGKKILISGGHTEEPLDGVRFLSNRSSGKTAVALARAFHLAGARVHLVLGLADAEPPAGMRVERVHTSAEFQKSMGRNQKDSDVVIMAAAIADFVPLKTDSGKWKSSRSLKNLELQPAPNILNELGSGKLPGQVLVGFALETKSPLEQGREKLKARNCDLMVVNTPLSNPGQGFGEDSVEAAILSAKKEPRPAKALSLMEKNQLAVELVRKVADALKAKA